MIQRLLTHPIRLPWRTWFALGAILTLNSCSNSAIQEEYASFKPSLSVRNFFNGQLSAHGIVKNRGGQVTRYFNADITASWDDRGIGTLDEYFIFNDGEQQRRVWTLEPISEGLYKASANDVVGSTQLKVEGNSLFMDYVLRLPRKDSTVDVNIDDRMYLVDENVIVNESVIRKFGIRFGSVTLTIIKQP